MPLAQPCNKVKQDSRRRFSTKVEEKEKVFAFRRRETLSQNLNLNLSRAERAESSPDNAFNLIHGNRERRGKNLTGLRDLSGFNLQPKQKSLPCTGQQSRGETRKALRVGKNEVFFYSFKFKPV